MPSICWDCHNCSVYFGGGCLAGNGDDFFTRIKEDDVIRMLETPYPASRRGNWKWGMQNELKAKFPNLSERIDTFMDSDASDISYASRCPYIHIPSQKCRGCGKIYD